jgi:hypothetical protein
MNRIRTAQAIRRWAIFLTGLAGALLTSGTLAPAAFARILPGSGGQPGTVRTPPPPPVHVIVFAGMPGWQITLIAAGAALAAALIAVALDRFRAARRQVARAAA